MSSTDLREISRNAVRIRVNHVALDLFAERGYEQVTVEQIAAAAGMSPRTFHRYFPAKEDVVIGDPTGYGELVARTFAARPSAEPVWTGLRTAFEALLEPALVGTDERGKLAMRLMGSTPALRARNLEKHLQWTRLLTPLVADRLGGRDATLRAEIVVQSALVCFDVALTSWAQGPDGDASVFLARAFAAIEPAPGGRPA